MRDSRANLAFWERRMAWFPPSFERFGKIYADPDETRRRQSSAASRLLSLFFEDCLLQYSIGAPMPEVVAPGLRGVGHLFPEMIARFGTDMPDGIAYFGSSTTLRYISTLVLCCASTSEAQAFFTAFDQFNLPNGYDRIWSAFRARMGQGEVAPQKDVHWPKAYANLWKAIDPEEPDFARPHHLKTFLNGWYKEMATELAAQTTRAENLSENSTYVGYWCIEAAAASVVFGIDDRSVRDHPHYPADWADWARNCRGLA